RSTEGGGLMAKIIETLTPAQWQQMRDYREEQRRLALRTDSIDQVAAKKSVRALYTAAGLKEPQYVFFFQSPMQCLLARGLLILGGVDRLGDQHWGQIEGQIGGQLKGQLRSQLWDQLEDQLEDQLRGQLRSQLW